MLSNGEEKLAERMVKDLEPRKSIGGLKQNEVLIEGRRRRGRVGTHSFHFVLLGGEGESDEDEEDETVAELKKPNSDEVRATEIGLMWCLTGW